MNSLLIMTALFLPSVVGNCCTPNVYECTNYRTKDPNRALRVLVNFSKGRLLTADIDTKYPIKFHLFDIANSVVYRQMRNGPCTTRVLWPGSFDTHQQCTDNATNTGHFTMGNGIEAVSYVFKGPSRKVQMILSKDTCLPMISVATHADNTITTTLFVDVKSDNVDDTDLEPDLCQCVPESSEVV